MCCGVISIAISLPASCDGGVAAVNGPYRASLAGRNKWKLGSHVCSASVNARLRASSTDAKLSLTKLLALQPCVADTREEPSSTERGDEDEPDAEAEAEAEDGDMTGALTSGNIDMLTPSFINSNRRECKSCCMPDDAVTAAMLIG